MASIADKTTQIRSATYGKDVREALAGGIEAINTETEDTTKRQGTVEEEFKTIQNSESIRQTNETTRLQNENSRQATERTRVTAEESRATAETTRQNNEETRQSNETNREKIINAMKVCENYDPSHTYFQFNKAVDVGSTYECINQVAEGIKGIKPSTDSGTNWVCIASKGSDGVGGDMFKNTYDSNGNGIVDDAEKLGGKLPSNYAKQVDLDTLGQEVSSQKADLTYQIPTIVGTQIQIKKQSDSKRLYFKLASDLTGGAITISLDSGTTSKPLQDINSTAITQLEKGFVEVVEDTSFFTLRSRGISATDKQTLIDITNEAENNSDSTKTQVINALNNVSILNPLGLVNTNDWITVINKISNIKTGKKIATGAINSTSITKSLTFTPSIVYAYYRGTNHWFWGVNGIFPVPITIDSINSGITSTPYFYTDNSIFTFNIGTNSITILAPLYNGNYADGYWVAIE